jgi:hypothetical protein
MQIRATENVEEFGKCGCGRSPTGKCIGWHALSQEDYLAEKAEWEQSQKNARDLAEWQKTAQDLWNDSCTAPRSVPAEPVFAGAIPGLTPHLAVPSDKMSYGEFCEKFPVEDGDKITVDQVNELEEVHGISNYYEKLEIFRRQEYEKYLNGDPYYNA